MDTLKSWLADTGDGDWLGFPSRRHVLDLFREAQIITQDDNRPLHSGGGNPLVPYGTWKMADEKGATSGFLRDQPPLRAYAMSDPDNLASVIVFVLLTIRADFQQAVEDFRVIIPWLKSKYGKEQSSGRKNPTSPSGDDISQGVDTLQTKLSQIGNPARLDKDGFLQGYGLKATAFGFKNPAIADVWANRDEIFDKVGNFADKNDVVGMHKYITQRISGLGPVKAGFVVQLMMGKLGCIDMHNINLYSQYAKHYKKRGLYNALEPARYSGKDDKSINNYLKVLDLLAKEGADTIKLWDVWTNYVAVNYTSEGGRSRYDDTGKFSGHSVGEDDPLYQKLSQIGPVPDRSGGKDTIFKADGRSRGSLAASLGHATIYQIHDKKFWDDMLAAAENPMATPDPLRVKKPAASDQPAKALAYIVADPDLARSIGLDRDFIDRASEVLQKRSLLAGKHFLGKGGQRMLWNPEGLGAGHKPVRTKAAKPGAGPESPVADPYGGKSLF